MRDWDSKETKNQKDKETNIQRTKMKKFISHLDRSQNVKIYQWPTLQPLETVQYLTNMQYKSIRMLQTQEIALKTSFYTL